MPTGKEYREHLRGNHYKCCNGGTGGATKLYNDIVIQGHPLHKGKPPGDAYRIIVSQEESASASAAPPEIISVSTPAPAPAAALDHNPLTPPAPAPAIGSIMQLVVPSDSNSAAEAQPISPSAVLLSSSAEPRLEPELPHYHPCAIYQRYVTAREAWYKTLPRGDLKTNQQYRKAMGLPQRYSKKDYDWCLDYKQMGKQCVLKRPFRDWTKEEQMAYLDWTVAKDARVGA